MDTNIFDDERDAELIDGRLVEHASNGYGAPDDELDDFHFPDTRAIAELESTQ